MNNNKIAETFAKGKTSGRGSNMFISGDTIYSYGHHFPIAIRTTPELQRAIGKKYIFNMNGYSNSTAKHKNHVACALGYSNYIEVPNCDVSKTGLERFLNKIKMKEINLWETKLKSLKTKNGARAKGYQKKIDAGKEKYNTYENLMYNIYGGNSIKLIKSLAKELKGELEFAG